MKEKFLLKLAQHILMTSPISTNDMGYKQLVVWANQDDLTDLKTGLLNIAEQMADPRSRELTREAFGDDIVNIASKLHSITAPHIRG